MGNEGSYGPNVKGLNRVRLFAVQTYVSAPLWQYASPIIIDEKLLVIVVYRSSRLLQETLLYRRRQRHPIAS